MKGLRHDTTLIHRKVSYIEEYSESVELKLDNYITAIDVLYDRLQEKTRTKASLTDTIPKLKNGTETKLKAI